MAAKGLFVAQTDAIVLHVSQSDCSVCFNKKWIAWKQDVTTGLQCCKSSGKTIEEAASVNEGECLQRLFLLYVYVYLVFVCVHLQWRR